MPNVDLKLISKSIRNRFKYDIGTSLYQLFFMCNNSWTSRVIKEQTCTVKGSLCQHNKPCDFSVFQERLFLHLAQNKNIPFYKDFLSLMFYAFKGDFDQKDVLWFELWYDGPGKLKSVLIFLSQEGNWSQLLRKTGQVMMGGKVTKVLTVQILLSILFLCPQSKFVFPPSTEYTVFVKKPLFAFLCVQNILFSRRRVSIFIMLVC